jgi:hypothetical protein
MYAVKNGTMYCGLKFDTIILQYKFSNPAPDTLVFLIVQCLRKVFPRHKVPLSFSCHVHPDFMNLSGLADKY